MYYYNTRMVLPRPYDDPEFRIPTEAVLRGVCYDYDEQCIIVFDNEERKFMWIDPDTCVMYRSVHMPLPNGAELIDACTFKDNIFCLVYMGNGRMSIGQGSLSQGKYDGLLDLALYPMPYLDYVPINTTVWTMTHNGAMKYLRYHPRFCSIFCIGTELYVVAGLTNDVTNFNSVSQGQWIIHYDLSGLFVNWYKADHSTSYTNRPHFMDHSLNGRLVCADSHDGIIAGIAASTQDWFTASMKQLKPVGNGYTATTQFFVTGPFDIGASMCAVGRKLYYLAGNKLFVSDIFMFDLWTTDEVGMIQNTIDMGTIPLGGVMRRKVHMRNSSPYYNYSNLQLSVVVPDISLSKTGEFGTWSDSIKFTGPVKVNDVIEFFVQLESPPLTISEIPFQFHDKIIITSAAAWNEV